MLLSRIMEIATRDYLDSIISNMIDTLVVVDPDGMIKTVNPAILNLLEYFEEELLGRPMGILLEEEDLFFTLRGLIEAGSVHEFELAYMTKHGRKIPMSCSGSVVADSNGIVQGIVCIAKDITERKQAEQALRESEERFRSLFQNIPIGVYRMTSDCRIVNANPALLKMLGYGSLEEAVAYTFEADSRTEFQEQIQRDGKIMALESIWKRRDNSLLHVSENAQIIRSAEGDLLYYEGTVEDITERKRIEQTKNEFISIVSHELRVPLTSIRGSLEWTVEKFAQQLPEKARKMIEIASRSSERMVRLINNMLDIDKIESGRVQLDLKPVDLIPLLEQITEANQAYGAQFGVNFLVQCDLDAVRVQVDSDRIMQVMTNLLSNAAKFSAPNETVLVSISRSGEKVRVSVTDHGAGIPEKFRGRIFQKFAQGFSAGTRQKSGTGLGLNISKAIIERHGGTIGFETGAGRGTTFYFELPEWKD